MTRARALRGGLLVVACALAIACSRDEAPPAEVDAGPVGAYGSWADPLAALPRGAEQLARVCAREGDDPIRSMFCASQPPPIESLIDLQLALGLDSAQIGGISRSLPVRVNVPDPCPRPRIESGHADVHIYAYGGIIARSAGTSSG